METNAIKVSFGSLSSKPECSVTLWLQMGHSCHIYHQRWPHLKITKMAFQVVCKNPNIFKTQTGKPWILIWTQPNQTWARILGFRVRYGFSTTPGNCQKNKSKNFNDLFFSTDPFLLVNAQSGTDWIKFNVGQYGFYRVNYPESEWAQFAQLLMKSHEVNRIFQRKLTTMVFLIVRVQWI